ncbi:hypothetical protein BH24ACT15_BH24ACT15_37110 [soil metagenome]
MDFLGGLLASVARWVRDRLTDRPSLAIVSNVVDHGPVGGGSSSVAYMRVRNGVSLDVKVHNDGKRPMQITEVGVLSRKGKRRVLDGGDRLPALLQPAESIERHADLDMIRRDLGDDVATHVYAEWGANHVWKQDIGVDPLVLRP